VGLQSIRYTFSGRLKARRICTILTARHLLTSKRLYWVNQPTLRLELPVPPRTRSYRGASSDSAHETTSQALPLSPVM
jgi:hypothetical protein